ncbi:MAG: hypothetical protein HWE23_13725 [Rhodobacteraceae bacterium]|nr:hypothetical protein [Paracoccaceae bacterium]
MAYDKVQFIGYQIYTGPAKPASGKPHYVGLDSDAEDIKARVKIMGQAIEKAYETSQKAAEDAAKAAREHSGAASGGGSSDATDPGQILTIFMAPEFYFRGKNGAYDIQYLTGDVSTEHKPSDTPSLVDMLAELISDSKYKDWLFVFGTGVFKSINPRTNTYEAYNVAIVQKGGEAHPEDAIKKRVVCMKEHLSSIDFLDAPDEGITKTSVAHLPAVTDVSYDREINTPGLKGGGANGGAIFNLEGITFGLEVCLDHYERRLVRAAPQKGQFYVQIQLIPSGGMNILLPSVATCKNGLTFNVDGYNHYKDGLYFLGYHTDLWQTSETLPFNMGQCTPLAPHDKGISLAHGDLTDFEKLFWIPPAHAGVPCDWKPTLVLYPLLPMPAPTTKTA